jgi:hypothetical protein
MWSATAFHLYLDIRSGGIALFNPFGAIVGDYFIKWKYWMTADIIIIGLTAISGTMIMLKENKTSNFFSDYFSTQRDIIKTGKVHKLGFILSGLFIGLILNLGDFYLNGMILGDQWRHTMLSLNRNPLGIHVMLLFFLINFMLGIMIIWLYVITSARFGQGYKSAMITGMMTWILVWLWSYLVNFFMDLYPLKIMLVSITWGFFQVIIASLAGSMIYDFAYKGKKSY